MRTTWIARATDSAASWMACAALLGAVLAATAPVVAAPQPFSVEFAPESRPCCYHRSGNGNNTPDDTPLMRGVTVAGSTGATTSCRVHPS